MTFVSLNSLFGATVEEAHQLFEEGSYALAADAYKGLIENRELTDPEDLRLKLGLLKSQWRVAAADSQNDQLGESINQLALMAREMRGQGRRPPRLWSEVRSEEGLAWLHGMNNWEQAWPALSEVLEYWAESSDLVEARKRYLGLLRSISGNQREVTHRYMWTILYNLPVNIAEDATRIAETPEDRAWSQLLLARLLSRNYQAGQRQLQIGEALRAVVAAGPESSHYEQGLLEFAAWLERYGHSSFDVAGNLQFAPDFEAALTHYNMLIDAFPKGEGNFAEQAQRAVDEITKQQLHVLVAHTFRPQAEVQFLVRWRNHESVQLRLYPVNLTEALAAQSKWPDWNDYDLAESVPFMERTLDRKPQRPYYYSSERIRLDELPAGAWLVTATAGGERSTELLLVTDISVVLKSSQSQGLVYVTDAATGAPIEGVQVSLLDHRTKYTQPGQQAVSVKHLKGQTDAAGVVVFDVEVEDSYKREPHSQRIWVAAGVDQRQTFTISNNSRSYYRHHNSRPLVYTYSERTIYRPQEKVQWRVIVRDSATGSLTVPSGLTLGYEVVDPRGEVVDIGTVELNEFGSASGGFTPAANATLGEYLIHFSDEGALDTYTSLFRLEEYRVPEFKVAINMPAASGNGDATIFRPGETVEATVQVEYYFGGAVSDAEVEVVVTEEPIEFWFWDNPTEPWKGDGEVVERLQLTTDSRGSVNFRFNTNPQTDTDLSYRIEARVRDSSRREVVEQLEVKVSRQGYYADVRPARRLFQTGDLVELTVVTEDINKNPVSRTGRLRITRERWREIFIHNKRGHEIDGEEFRALPDRALIGATRSDYRLLQEGFVTEEVVISEVTTGDDGKGSYLFRSAPAGYYSVTWIGGDDNRPPVRAESAFWVADVATPEFGYRPGGVEIIVDPRAYNLGEKVPVLISTASSGRHVLITRGADEMFSHEVVKVEGTARLVYLTMTEQDVPNVFVDATMVSGEEIFMDEKQLTVPARDKQLQVSILSPQAGYRPGDKARFDLQVLDAAGQPVVGEFSLAFIDAALFSLQPEYNGPLVEFFHQPRRGYLTQTTSSFATRPFFRPLEEKSELAELSGGEQEDIFELGSFYVASSTNSGTRLNMAKGLGADAVASASASPSPRLRKDFSNSILWQPHVVTDATGKASVEVTFPDSLTTWRMTALGVDKQSRMGEARLETVTRLPVIARLQSPRFLTQYDRTTLSGVIHNNTRRDLTIEVQLEVEGPVRLEVESMQSVNIAAGQSRRVDWPAEVEAGGNVRMRLTASSSEGSDAMERSYVVYPYGLTQQLTTAVRSRDEALRWSFELPAGLDFDQIGMDVTLTPSLAVSVLQSLPYLVEYPYGCTEQTVSRFVPLWVLRRTLIDQGFNTEAIDTIVFGESQVDDATGSNMDLLLEEGWKKLTESQKEDGSWPWMPGGSSDLYMTAYAVWGLSQIVEVVEEQAGDEVEGMLENARRFLELRLMEVADQPHLRAWMLHALSSRYRTGDAGRPTRFEARAFLELMETREGFSAQTLALLALSAKDFGFTEDAKVLLRNLSNTVQIQQLQLAGVESEALNGEWAPLQQELVYWGQTSFDTWRQQNPVETTALVLMALLELDPGNAWLEPAMHWLVQNREGSRWPNTRSTGISVMALAEYLRIRDEINTVASFTVLLNGADQGSVDVNLYNTITEPQHLRLEPALLQAGQNVLEVVRHGGDAPLYLTAAVQFLTTERPIKATGFQVGLVRQYYALRPLPTLLKGYREELTPLQEGDTVQSGNRIEAVMHISAERDLHYVLLEDPKPAGAESTLLFSGESMFAREIKPGSDPRDAAESRYTGRSVPVFSQNRDQLTALFLDRLPQGEWEIRYRLRSETPGLYHVLPAAVHAMYLPVIRGNSADAVMQLSTSGSQGQNAPVP